MFLVLLVQMFQHIHIQSNPVQAVNAERRQDGAWLVIRTPIWSPKQKKNQTISFIILLHIHLMLSHVPYVIYCIIFFFSTRRVYLSSSSLEVFGDDDQSYLQKRRAVEETFRELVQRDSFPIINNNPPHFLFRLSDVCISFVFLIGEVWLNPAPSVIWH